ncbi:MAG: hypothetical protein WCG15_00020 [Actinomycetes bacterium]
MSDYYSETLDALPLFAAAEGKIELPIRCAVSKELRIRAGSQRWTLLRQYVEHGPLTNEQAGDLSGLSEKKSCCYWKRCGELLQHGYLADTGVEIRSQVGEMQRVCRVTDKGLAAIQATAASR